MLYTLVKFLDVCLIFGNAPRVLMSSEKTVSSGIQSPGLGAISSEMQSQHFQVKPYTSQRWLEQE